MGKLTRRSLRAMRERWKVDLARLEADYPVTNWEASEPTLETIRNLATAIAEIDGIITNAMIFPAKRIPAGRAALSEGEP